MTDTTLPSSTVTPASPYKADKRATSSSFVPERAAPSAAFDRLESSRAQVRSALMVIAHPPPTAKAAGLGRKLTSLLNRVPGSALVLDTAKSWWLDHRHTAQTVGRASQALVRPIAKRHPAGLVGSALAAGAVVVLLRPWRLLLRPKILMGAASLIAAQAVKRRSPTSWVQMAVKLAGSSKKTRR